MPLESSWRVELWVCDMVYKARAMVQFFGQCNCSWAHLVPVSLCAGISPRLEHVHTEESTTRRTNSYFYPQEMLVSCRRELACSLYIFNNINITNSRVPFPQITGFPWLLGKLTINWVWWKGRPDLSRIPPASYGWVWAQQMVRFLSYGNSCSQSEVSLLELTLPLRRGCQVF